MLSSSQIRGLLSHHGGAVLALLATALAVGSLQFYIYGNSFLGIPGELPGVYLWSMLDVNETLAQLYRYSGANALPFEHADTYYKAWYVPYTRMLINLFAYDGEYLSGFVRLQVACIFVYGLTMYSLLIHLTGNQALSVAVTVLGGFHRDAFVKWWGFYTLNSISAPVLDVLFPLFVLIVLVHGERFAYMLLAFSLIGFLSNVRPAEGIHVFLIISFFYLARARFSLMSFLLMLPYGLATLFFVLPYYLHHMSTVGTGKLAKIYSSMVYSLPPIEFLAWLHSEGAIAYSLSYFLPSLLIAVLASGFLWARGRIRGLSSMGLLLAVVLFVAVIFEYLAKMLGLPKLVGMELRTLRAVKFAYPVFYCIIALGLKEWVAIFPKRKALALALGLLVTAGAFVRPGDFRFPIGNLALDTGIAIARRSAHIRKWRDDVEEWRRVSGPYRETVDWLRNRGVQHERIIFVYQGLPKNLGRKTNLAVYPILDTKAYILNYAAAFTFDADWFGLLEKIPNGLKIGEAAMESCTGPREDCPDITDYICGLYAKTGPDIHELCRELEDKTGLVKLEKKYLSLFQMDAGPGPRVIAELMEYARNARAKYLVLEKPPQSKRGLMSPCFENARFVVFCIPGGGGAPSGKKGNQGRAPE